MAILIAISVLSKNCHTQIYIDNQVAIDGINTTKLQTIKINLKKLKNHHILQQIIEISLAQNISLDLYKVLAHSGIILNEKADQLA